jgi:hypothetical protein
MKLKSELHVQAYLASRERVTDARYMSGRGSIFALRNVN